MFKRKLNLSDRGIFLVLICFLFGVLIGWWIWGSQLSKARIPPAALRLNGYGLVSPLLVCSTNSSEIRTELIPLETRLKQIFNKAVNQGQITTASIYFRRLKNGGEIEINGQEKFSPASLRKVPLLMALYKSVERNPSFLRKTKIEVSGNDQNQGQEIRPKDFAAPGNTYFVEDLIKKMIVDSDNNSASVLVSLVGEQALPDLFAKLQIPFVDVDRKIGDLKAGDFITARNFSLFLRVLYNATYLDDNFSEKAMDLLTKVDYKNGLVAGVPAEIRVAHKFGLWTAKVVNSDQVVSRELHDCGVIYDPKSPYILCVLTKSQADITRIESFIKDVSAAVYQENTKFNN